MYVSIFEEYLSKCLCLLKCLCAPFSVFLPQCLPKCRSQRQHHLVGQATADLQLLPDGPQTIHVGVVQVEDGVKGTVVQSGQGVVGEAANQEVNGVVGHLELDFKVTEVGLLKGQQHGVKQTRVVAIAGRF